MSASCAAQIAGTYQLTSQLVKTTGKITTATAYQTPEAARQRSSVVLAFSAALTRASSTSVPQSASVLAGCRTAVFVVPGVVPCGAAGHGGGRSRRWKAPECELLRTDQR